MLDNKYYYIIKDIIENKEFNKIETEKHHGNTRMVHSKRVSYYSYKICKILGFDYISAARAGLLHDFFLYEENITKKEKFKMLFKHPKQAVKNSEQYFILTEKEKNIIASHMFPINTNLPKYIESWIITLVDKIVATYEFAESFSIKNSYKPNPYLTVLINIFN